MINVKVKHIRDGRHPLPKYATSGSAGLDFYAYINCGCCDDPKHSPEGHVPTETILPGSRKLIPLGVAMSIPEGYELQLRPRSGLALKHGITLINSPGTINDKSMSNLWGRI